MLANHKKKKSFPCKHAKDDEPTEIKIIIIGSNITMGQN